MARLRRETRAEWQPRQEKSGRISTKGTSALQGRERGNRYDFRGAASLCTRRGKVL